ncbi:fructosamine/ketosamine-3-kinase [Sporocytophaga myxococcoides]|uniref:Fructosamine/ketosamine-3-kinase n=1 Tax=Sporocytophaga myxococcoides TaxID=153721 RepID=A0A098L8G2_9BACT|nr:fructosamine kinase family protein [Sporocytophaga myxococcoides]GAL83011.1 fructosamine/ketosamine-3-kinase [Sporocytophaga myxococcoides]
MEAVSDLLNEVIHEGIDSIAPVGGGSINNTYKVKTSRKVYFVKVNRNVPEDFFEKEAEGLSLLAKTNRIRIPEIIFIGRNLLVMEFIERGLESKNYWFKLGQKLSDIHKVTASSFGLDYNNYIGSLEQLNGWYSNWPEFFVERRIFPLAHRAYADGRLERRGVELIEQLSKKINDLLVHEKPSLLHGDLWSGNVMVDLSEAPVFVDPAVYYGNREIEIAFTTLFGGFDPLFYESYQEAFPLEKNFDKRIDLYNLYPLLVHANLFGGSYSNSVMTILRRFA